MRWVVDMMGMVGMVDKVGMVGMVVEDEVVESCGSGRLWSRSRPS